MRRIATIALLATLLATVLGVPGPVGAAPAAGGREALGAVERIRIVDFRFRPRRITVERGTRVRWINRGGTSHTTTSDDGLWDSGTLAPGEPYGRRFRRVGEYEFHCEIHSSMTGTIVVTRT